MTNPIPITLAPDQLASLADGGTTIFVRMEPQIEDWQMCLGFPVTHDDDGSLMPINPPFTIGDTLVVREEWINVAWLEDWARPRAIHHDDGGEIVILRREFLGLYIEDAEGKTSDPDWQPADTMPLWAARFKLTVTTEPTPVEVDGVWGFKAGVEPQS